MNDLRETAETVRQPWETPKLFNLSTRRTESGEPSSVEGIIVVSSTLVIPIGPITSDGS